MTLRCRTTPLACRAGVWRLVVVGLLLAPAPARAQEVIEYYATDHLGSIRVVFDATGNVVARADYLPFGEEVFAAGAMPAEHFTGQQRDGEAGLDYFHARQYQPRTGRFNAVDPVFVGPTDPQQWNRYAYARSNPLAFTDKTGLQASSCVSSEVYVYHMVNGVAEFSHIANSVHCTEGGGGGGIGAFVLSTLLDLAPFSTIIDSSDLFPTRHGVEVNDAAQAAIAAAALAAAAFIPGDNGEKKLAGSVVDSLSKAAGKSDRNGLTLAGRALQKHGSRSGSVFPNVRGHDALNQIGQEIVDNILTTPGTVAAANRFGGLDIISPTGQGLRYNSAGDLIGFLEPSR